MLVKNLDAGKKFTTEQSKKIAEWAKDRLDKIKNDPTLLEYVRRVYRYFDKDPGDPKKQNLI
ncbi:hypothetical protein A3A67_02460 [Candidatus Peribacteria bacterium RIFCSPLOWO2_01_FULL_51_18]|nr:MAG: hypothetical protein A3C52_04860 [Candidatus Peribacteria bacterium RIFCSPHIGHO2_02_FULL_51_15]OGJ66876.1 MAG: hypothetical protein A3A67_02460 [Candidatus Peribacteria bacterium RIFCSPLOWO2_01_FULL_51_18]OGJ68588.1 MAG: hypothetical protein A3J34_04295 [Candidatus Peribacteria bacterium RIFCSPLOWO2_02_FULL_51_10]